MTMLREASPVSSPVSQLEAGEESDLDRVARVVAEDNFRCLIEQSLVGVYIIQDGRYRYVNPKWSQLCGYSIEELYSMDFLQVIPEPDRSVIREKVRARVSGGVPEEHYTTRFQKKDGTLGLLEVHGSLIQYEGRPAVLGSVLDVTERSRMEAHLEHLAQSLQLLLESTAEGIFTIDLDGRCTMINRAAAHLLGYTAEDLARLVGGKVHGVFHGRRNNATIIPEIESPILQCLHTGTGTRVHEDFFWRKEGSPIPVSYSASPIFEDGKLRGTVVSFSDITERKLLENQLALANRLTSLGRLSATVAHEFNNVLMGIQPFADLIRKRAADPEISQAADRIVNSIQRGKGVTLEILRFTQPAEPAIEAINVGPWLSAVTSGLRSALAPSIKLALTLPDAKSPIFVAGDPSQLDQVLTNLVFNARDAMPDGGTLFIGVSHCRSGTAFRFGVVNTPDQFVHLVVRDTGIGISAETMNHIFEPLFTTKKSGGTGLGLAVAHQIVLRHKGHIFAESMPGEGATFHVFLPVTYPQLMVPKFNASIKKSSVRRVLMVEDDVAVSEGLVALFETEGIAVEVVSRGADAEAAVVRFNPEVVLLDIGLPDMDGTDVYHLLTKRWPKLPIVFSTGHGDEKKLEPYLSRAEVRFLMKPYDFATLIKVLHSIAG